MRLFFCLLGTLLMTTQLSAQSADVAGRVVDATGRPVDFANVLLLQPADSSLITGTLTDSLGSYVLEDVTAGEYLVRTDLIGFEPAFHGPFQVNGQNQKLPALTLREAAAELSEVTVKARKPFIEMQAERLVMNVESSPVAAGNNALEVLAKAPGVVLDQNRNISLRGKQGVQIYIDGKPTYMSGQELAQMLEGMSASSVETIEIILSPSAKYDAAGNAGIINIRLKRDKSLGFNGTVRIGGGYGYGPKADEGLRLNYRGKTVAVFGEYNFWYNENFQDLNIYRTVPYADGLTVFDQNSFQDRMNRNHNYRVGADFYLSKRTTIGLMARRNDGFYSEQPNSKVNISGTSPHAYTRLESDNLAEDNYDNFLYNLNVSHEFAKEGRKLTFDIDYSGSNGSENGRFDNYFFNAEGQPVGTPNLIRTANASNVDIYAAKLDYSHSLGKAGNLETGWKSSYVETMNGILFERAQDNVYVPDSMLTNAFDFEEVIHAAYLNYSVGLGKYQVQAGLRAELTDNEGYSRTLDSRTARDYLNLFPSLSVSRQLNDNHALSLSYSRRIDRPAYQRLNPFFYFLDQFTFGKGNPYLQPQFTNAYNLNYSFKQQYILSLGYSNTKRAMVDVLEQDDATQQTFQTARNLEDVSSYNLNLSAPFTIADWWTTRLALSGMYNRNRSSDPEYSFDLTNYGYYARVSNEFQVLKGLTAELSGFYQSKMLWGNFQTKPQYQVDAGLSAKVLKGRGTLSVSFNDVFRTMLFGAVVDQGSLQVDLDSYHESQRVFFKLNYNFGSSEVKQERRRSSASEDETQRAGN